MFTFYIENHETYILDVSMLARSKLTRFRVCLSSFQCTEHLDIALICC